MIPHCNNAFPNFFKTIFLADDDCEDREFFAEALKEIDPSARLVTSRNGAELMELLQKDTTPKPDIIFLDLNMPLKDGFECLHEIKSNETLKDAIVVIFTTSGFKEDIDITYDKGASLFVIKPNDYYILIDTIRKVFTVCSENGFSQPAKPEFALL